MAYSTNLKKGVKMPKLSDKYNIKSFSDVHRQPVVDGGGVLLSRHLTYVHPEIFKQQYADLIFDKVGLTIDNSGGAAPYIQSLRKRVEGGFGDVGTDSGKISFSVEDSLLPVYDRDAKLRWHKRDVDRARIAKISLVAENFSAVNIAYNQELDTALVNGLPSKNMKGLTSNTHYAVDTDTEDLSAAEAKQIFNWTVGHINSQLSEVNNTKAYMANICLMSVDFYNKCSGLTLNTFTSESVLDVLRKRFKYMRFLSSAKVADDEMVLFSNDRQAACYRIPLPLEIAPIDREGWTFKTECLYAIGGLDVLEPSSGRIVKGFTI
jgi:hypothetical protein